MRLPFVPILSLAIVGEFEGRGVRFGLVDPTSTVPAVARVDALAPPIPQTNPPTSRR